MLRLDLLVLLATFTTGSHGLLRMNLLKTNGSIFHHILLRRETFDPNSLPAGSFNPSQYKSQGFNPSSYTAQPYNPGAYQSPRYNATGANQLQGNSQDPTNFQLGASGGGTAGGFNPDAVNSNLFNFLNPSSHFNGGSSGGTVGQTGGSASIPSYNPPSLSSSSGNFNPNNLAASNPVGQTGNIAQTGAASQTGSSFSQIGNGGQSGGGVGFNPNTANNMISGYGTQSGSMTGGSLGQTGSMSSSANFNPNTLGAMSAAQTG